MEGKNKQKILKIAEAFEKYFKQFGFKKTSVDEVAKELKISKKTIYQHFSSKEKIFYYLVSRVAEKYAAKMNKKLDKHQTAEGKLHDMVSQIFQETRRWLKSGNDAFEFRYKYDIAQLAFKEAYNKVIADIIAEGIEQKEFQDGEIKYKVSMINGIFSETMKHFAVNPDEDYRIVADSIIKLLK